MGERETWEDGNAMVSLWLRKAENDVLIVTKIEHAVESENIPSLQAETVPTVFPLRSLGTVVLSVIKILTIGAKYHLGKPWQL